MLNWSWRESVSPLILYLQGIALNLDSESALILVSLRRTTEHCVSICRAEVSSIFQSTKAIACTVSVSSSHTSHLLLTLSLNESLLIVVWLKKNPSDGRHYIIQQDDFYQPEVSFHYSNMQFCD